uniref:Uncharacterized protein n=1 Tax=Glossina pallidipes TaxID=7398 RepID=A0A1A9ZDL0_GLOPL
MNVKKRCKSKKATMLQMVEQQEWAKLAITKACLILLQTIPDTMDMDKFERFQLSKFPQTLDLYSSALWLYNKLNLGFMSRLLCLAALLDFLSNTTEQILHSKQSHNASQIFGIQLISTKKLIINENGCSECYSFCMKIVSTRANPVKP